MNNPLKMESNMSPEAKRAVYEDAVAYVNAQGINIHDLWCYVSILDAREQRDEFNTTESKAPRAEGSQTLRGAIEEMFDSDFAYDNNDNDREAVNALAEVLFPEEYAETSQMPGEA